MVTVTTPTGAQFCGVHLDPTRSLCGVSIVRGGEALEDTLVTLEPGIPLGRVVVQQTADKAAGPRLYYCNLPPDVEHRKVILMDSTVSTANAAQMAVQVLIDHGVAVASIVLVCVLAAPQGIDVLLRAFPGLRLVVASIEDGLDEQLFCVPGLGAFGPRYFE